MTSHQFQFCLRSEAFQTRHSFIVSFMFIIPVNRMWMIEKRCKEGQRRIKSNMQKLVAEGWLWLNWGLQCPLYSVLCSLIALKSCWLDLIRGGERFCRRLVPRKNPETEIKSKRLIGECSWDHLWEGRERGRMGKGQKKVHIWCLCWR